MTFKTDIANIFLMFLAAGLALLLPFELFLISYAILGPLHYLTEIFWLHKKQYFLPRKKDYFLLMVVCLLAAFMVSIISLWDLAKDSSLVEIFLRKFGLTKNSFQNELYSWSPCLVFLAFATAFIAAFIRDWWLRVNSFAIAFFLLLTFRGTWEYSLFFGILLTTVIHVWLFTGIFILSGAIKNGAVSTYFSFAVFLACSAVFFFISRSDYAASNYAIEVFNSGNFGINEAIFKIFGLPFEKSDLIHSTNGIKIQGFLAFAYSYHYLNWFSKVEIIRWHQVPKKFLIFSLIIWIASIALYAYNYRFGFYFLLFLSMLHVFLEFPLNFHSIATTFGRKTILNKIHN
jgi:hypothetical protein